MSGSFTASTPIFTFPSGFSSSNLGIPSDSFIPGTDETPGLASPLFDSMNPSVAGSQNQLTDIFAADYDPCGHPVFDSDGEIDTSSAATRHVSAPRKEGCKASKRDSRPHKRRKSLNTWDDATELMVRGLSQSVLCENFYSLLESELPRWTREGLWSETPHNLATPRTTSPSPSSYSKLERAYLAVCQLDSRMSNDLVRNRMALIQLHLEYTETHQVRRQTSASNRTTSTRGRGEASHVIDHILENTHEGWKMLDLRRQAELRVKFHDRKKYGKRWSQLASAFGPGILLISSTKLANAM